MKLIATWTLLALSASLAGCSASNQTANRSLESVHQPVVSNSSHVFDVASYGGEISPSEAQRVEQWLQAISVGYGDQIILEDDSIYGNPAAVTTLRQLVAKRGANIAAVVQGDALRLRVTRSVAYVPNCPDWSGRYTVDPVNATSTNYGCAVNSNLAAMIADPNDLVRGIASTTSNGQQAVKAIKAYRDKPATGAGELKSSETSEVGDGGGQ